MYNVSLSFFLRSVSPFGQMMPKQEGRQGAPVAPMMPLYPTYVPNQKFDKTILYPYYV